MPRVVDREARRHEIVDAYARLVSRDGIGAATSRALARELGVSHGALWHYFDGFDDVLEQALEVIFARSGARIAATREGRSGLVALRAILAELLPQSPEAMQEAVVVVSFWGRIARDFDRAGYERQQQAIEEVIVDVLGEAVADGTLVGQTPIEDIAGLVMSIATSLQVESVLGTALGRSAGRQMRLVESCLGPWRAPGPGQSTR